MGQVLLLRNWAGQPTNTEEAFIILDRPTLKNPAPFVKDVVKLKNRKRLHDIFEERISQGKDLTLIDAVVIMSEDNPGGAVAIMKMINEIINIKGYDKEKGVFTAKQLLMHLDDMNMRGSQIHIAYTDYAQRNVPLLLLSVMEHSPEMITFVNKFCEPSIGEKAVYSVSDIVEES
jgi:hypothetical protein